MLIMNVNKKRSVKVKTREICKRKVNKRRRVTGTTTMRKGKRSINKKKMLRRLKKKTVSFNYLTSLSLKR